MGIEYDTVISPNFCYNSQITLFTNPPKYYAKVNGECKTIVLYDVYKYCKENDIDPPDYIQGYEERYLYDKSCEVMITHIQNGESDDMISSEKVFQLKDLKIFMKEAFKFEQDAIIKHLINVDILTSHTLVEILIKYDSKVIENTRGVISINRLNPELFANNLILLKFAILANNSVSYIFEALIKSLKIRNEIAIACITEELISQLSPVDLNSASGSILDLLCVAVKHENVDMVKYIMEKLLLPNNIAITDKALFKLMFPYANKNRYNTHVGQPNYELIISYLTDFMLLKSIKIRNDIAFNLKKHNLDLYKYFHYNNLLETQQSNIQVNITKIGKECNIGNNTDLTKCDINIFDEEMENLSDGFRSATDGDKKIKLSSTNGDISSIRVEFSGITVDNIYYTLAGYKIPLKYSDETNKTSVYTIEFLYPVHTSCSTVSQYLFMENIVVLEGETVSITCNIEKDTDLDICTHKEFTQPITDEFRFSVRTIGRKKKTKKVGKVKKVFRGMGMLT